MRGRAGCLVKLFRYFLQNSTRCNHLQAHNSPGLLITGLPRSPLLHLAFTAGSNDCFCAECSTNWLPGCPSLSPTDNCAVCWAWK